jgi:hypothetical protein
MITENGLLWQKNQSSRLRIKPKKDSKKLYFGFSKSKNDTLRHSIPIVIYFEYLFAISFH